MKTTLVFISLLGLMLLVSCKEKNQQETETLNSKYLSPTTMCGTVQFSDGCGPALDSLIQFGLALVHHMTYEDARYTFGQVIEKDPQCFWGYWGKAMTYIHPLWPDEPSQEELAEGWELSQKALKKAKDEKEKGYGKAIAAYYENGRDKTEKERLLAFEKGWEAVHKQFPIDLEAELFHGLSKLATVSPADKSYMVQKEVGKTAEMALQEIPDHPGGFHYAIHAYDVPTLASNALRVARNYGKIAPEIPHALHMPSHIFTRLGYWQESIDWNIRSAQAALNYPFQGKVSMQYFHALDYLVYAYLQKAEDEKADRILATVDTLNGPYQEHAGTAFMLAAVPARLAVERHDWEKASQLPERQPTHFAWEKFPAFEALTHFAKGIGGARAANESQALESIQKLQNIKDILEENKSLNYWAEQVKIQLTAVQAWLLFAQNQKDQALVTLQKAAEMEAATEKSPITPGELLPMKEMLGDMLYEMDMPEKALVAYGEALQRNPNRFNSIFGAGKAAEKAGNLEQAKIYYNQLIDLVGKQSSSRPEIQHARNFLKVQQS